MLNYGIKIESDTLITVVYEAVTNVNNPETYSLKGTNGLGMEFITPFQTTWRNGSYPPTQPKSMICIVATEDNTTVWITPKATVVGHPANITYSIVLNKGQVYTVENVSQLTNTPGNNLSGSIVVSNKPIAVTVSDDSVWNAAGGGCRDLMGDQLVPVDVIGTEYIVNKGNMNVASTEGMYIVATENFTTVTVINASGTTVQLLNRGDTWNYVIVDPLSYVQSDKPIYLLQASGFGCELGEAILPPINCAGSAQVSFNRSNSQTFILNVLCPTTAINDFLMDGNPAMVPGSAFNPVPGTGGFWSGAQITYTTAQIPAGSSPFLENTSDFFALGVINGGSTSGCFYHYMSSFIRRVYTKAGNSLTFVLSSTGNCIAVTDTVVVDFIQAPVVNAGLDDSYCKNNVGDVPINGNVQYASTGLWSGGNGGAFGNSNSLSTTYTPSPAELAADSVALFLTSAGSFFSCPSDEDTLVIYFTPAPLVVAGGDQVLCSNATEAVLNGAISGATTTGIWSTSGTGAFSPSETNLITDYLISVSDTAAGSIYLTLTSTNNQNCLVERDSIQLTIIPQPELTITSQDSVCSNSVTIDLTGTIVNGFGTEWTTNGFGTIANPNNLNTIYTVSPIDVLNGFIDVFFNTTGVCAIEGDSLRIYFIDPPIADAGIDQAYCENTPIQLNGTVTGPNPAGLWSSMGTGSFNPGNAFLQTLYFPSAADVTNGGVSLILTPNNTFGCVSENDTVFIVFKEIPQADFTVNSVCQGENALFLDQSTATGSITDWLWDFDDSQSSITQNPLHQFVTSGTFDVSLIVTGSNDCVDTAIYSLVINPLPNPMFTNTNACENGIIFFTDVSTISSGTNTAWLYDFFSFGSSTDQMPQFSFNAPGTYPVSFTVTSNFGCEASIVQDVVVLPSPVANFTMNPNPALALQDVVFTTQEVRTQWY